MFSNDPLACWVVDEVEVAGFQDLKTVLVVFWLFCLRISPCVVDIHVPCQYSPEGKLSGQQFSLYCVFQGSVNYLFLLVDVRNVDLSNRLCPHFDT